jgi:hypothetical protein
MGGPDLAKEIWSELKTYISEIDRGDAADVLISVLVDNDYDINEIKAAFKGDNTVKNAIASYIEEEEEDVEEDYDYEDDEDY